MTKRPDVSLGRDSSSLTIDNNSNSKQKEAKVRMVFNSAAQTLTCGGLICKAWSKVRNELNGQRELTSIAVRSERENGEPGVPYMPRVFPKGVWRVTHVVDVDVSEPYLYPYFIATDAHQPVEEWSTKYDGTYDKPTGRMVEDFGYGLHFSTSPTTLGCGRVERKDDIEALVEIVKPLLKAGEVVELEVL